MIRLFFKFFDLHFAKKTYNIFTAQMKYETKNGIQCCQAISVILVRPFYNELQNEIIK